MQKHRRHNENPSNNFKSVINYLCLEFARKWDKWTQYYSSLNMPAVKSIIKIGCLAWAPHLWSILWFYKTINVENLRSYIIDVYNLYSVRHRMHWPNFFSNKMTSDMNSGHRCNSMKLQWWMRLELGQKHTQMDNKYTCDSLAKQILLYLVLIGNGIFRYLLLNEISNV